MPQPVYVTGIGLVCPAGCTLPQAWPALLAGERCIRDWGCSGTSRWLGAIVPGSPELPGESDPLACTGLDHVEQFAMSAADQAMRQAGLTADHLAMRPHRVRFSIGTSKGAITAFSAACEAWHDSINTGYCNNRIYDRRHTDRSASALAGLFKIAPDVAALAVARRWGITGGGLVPVAACATGMVAVMRAAQWIADGEADLVLAGGADAGLTPFWLAAFERMGVLAEPDAAGPMWACRPFDRDRQGFAVGEGAALLVLQSEASLAVTGARPLARVAGWKLATDPTSLTGGAPDGRVLANTIRRACDAAGIPPQVLAGVLAHGTGTVPNDRAEATALRDILSATDHRPPIISIKGMIGHLLGAAGAVELAVAVQACATRTLPGNATLRVLDPSFADLNLPIKSTAISPGPILKTSMGFGGHVAAMLITPVLA